MRKILFAFFSLICVFNFVLHTACKKEEDSNDDLNTEDFISALKKGWLMWDYNSTIYGGLVSYNLHNGVAVSYYAWSDSSQFLSINDPHLCSLIGIEDIAYWTFSEENGQLQLETQDLCGSTRNYYFNFSGLQGGENNIHPSFIQYKAKVRLVGQDTTIAFNSFTLYTSKEYPADGFMSFLYNTSYGWVDATLHPALQ